MTTDSYIVRIYRFDTEDERKVTGMVELMDGSGERKPFTDLSELAALLKQGNWKQRRSGKSTKVEPK